MDAQKWHHFGGFASWGAFDCPNRFCDEKVGSQRSQSALKDRQMSQKLHQRALRGRQWAPKVKFFGAMQKWAPKVNPFRSQARRTARSAYNSMNPKTYQSEKWSRIILPDPPTLPFQTPNPHLSRNSQTFLERNQTPIQIEHPMVGKYKGSHIIFSRYSNCL